MGVDSNLTGVPTFDTLEIVKTGSLSVTHTAGTTGASTTIQHDLGYLPIALVAYDAGDDTITLVPDLISILSGSDAGKVEYATRVAVDSTSLTVSIETPNLPAGSAFYNTDFTYPFKYYLLRQVSRQQ